MENRLEILHGPKIRKKSRSLDLKSVYKSSFSKESSEEAQNKTWKREGSSEEGDNKSKNKKSTKEAPLSSFKNVNSNIKKRSGDVFHSGLDSGLPESKDLGSEFNGISLSLNDNVVQIPKRKRDFVGRKKIDRSQALKPLGQSSGDVELVDQVDKIKCDESSTQDESFNLKQSEDFDDFKENRNGESSSALHLKEEDGCGSHSVVNSGDASPKKSPKKSRKRKDLAVDSKRVVKEAEPLVDNSTRIGDDPHEDDEENLEQNAARMLSSRFDPSCTGFSSSSKASASTNGLSFLLSSGQDFTSRMSKSLSGLEPASVDITGRVLRPRTQYNMKGHSRKRRHFYEIFSGDLDEYCVLNRRIKVFWPLDQSWYYGLVNDYDRERKLHHIKYDDLDEEWINLQNERIKLLLLPSEVPGKAVQKKSVTRDKHSDEREVNLKPIKEKEKKNFTPEDDSFMDSYLDSEPIISWLARSTRRVKSARFPALKKQKIPGPSLNSEPLVFPNEAHNVHKSLNGGSLKSDSSEVSIDSVLLDSLADPMKVENCDSDSTTCTRGSKFPIVYFRRRFRKTDESLCFTYKDNCISGSAPETVTSLAPVGDGFALLEERGISSGISRSPFDAELLKLIIPSIESRNFIFELSFPVLSVVNYLVGAEDFWLFHAVALLQHGTLITMWPKVNLEMLFVDNIVGLRFLLFEGCLKQAVAFVFWVLTVFHQPNEQEYIDTQLPVTSIRFKFSCIQDIRKQLVFAFYNFSELKKSKWMYVDSKLKEHCLLFKQLPLSECSYDNIRELQNETIQLLPTHASKDHTSIQGLQKMSRLGISHIGVSREVTCVDTGQSSNSDQRRKLPPFALSFAAAPTFFLGLHLKLLMDNSVAQISFQDLQTEEHPENSGSLIVDDCSSVECFNMGSEIALENNLKASSRIDACDGWLTCAKQELGTGFLTVCGDGDWIEPSWKYQNGDLNVPETSVGSEDHGKSENDDFQLQKWQCYQSELEQCVLSPMPCLGRDKSDDGSHSSLNGLKVEIPPFNQNKKPIGSESHGGLQASDLTWNMNGSIIPSPNPTASRSSWHRSRKNSNSPSFGYLSRMWSDENADIFNNSFGNGPKKPRTQVSYSLPFGGFDLSSKHRGHQQKGLTHKRIRRSNEKRSLDVFRGSKKNFELSCDANVLITLSERGWRVCGARVVLELVDHNEWKLAVKLSGTTKYSYKAHQFLLPGSTNRFTHAMMWKGGKDWILEFPDRSQWVLFKEMHEECYNRNARTASVKNIPIPGVRMIEENDNNGTEVAFVCSSSKYFRQVETDVEMALDPSRVLYDMDSDDEQWFLKHQKSSEIDSSISREISEEMFEKTMDMFEKAAYTQQNDQFTSDEIEELVTGIGPMKLIKTIYEHWWQKRLKKGLPLIRHLQPPLWERYQQQIREWELAMTKNNTTLPNGCQEKAAPVEKPPMFAFCLKPRGLEVPNKGTKHRPHRKFSLAGQNYAISGDQDGFHAFGRRLNGFAFGDEKVIYHDYESLDDSPLPQTSPRVFSPWDAGSIGYFLPSSDGFHRSHYPKLHRNKPRKFGAFVSTNDQQMVMPFNQRTMDKRNGVRRWNMGFPEWPSHRHYPSEGSQRHCFEQLDGSDLDEFRLRDASGAAQHALNMAKLKREKAQRLLYRADLAIHKAVVALMTAEAIKASSEDSNGDGYG